MLKFSNFVTMVDCAWAREHPRPAAQRIAGGHRVYLKVTSCERLRSRASWRHDRLQFRKLEQAIDPALAPETGFLHPAERRFGCRAGSGVQPDVTEVQLSD